MYQFWCSILLSFATIVGFAQPIDEQKYRTADSIGQSLKPKKDESLDAFFNSIPKEDKELALRIWYTWVINNIHYDMSLLQKLQQRHYSDDEIIKDAFKLRKGVCEHFSTLFNWGAHQLGYQAFSIEGYSKSLSDVVPQNHEWSAVYINNRYYFFDPTYDAGYYLNQKYVPNPSYDYYKKSPQAMIQSHMPFDPQQQLILPTISHQDFGKAFQVSHQKEVTDLSVLLGESTLDSFQKIERLINRIESNQPYPEIVRTRLSILKKIKDVYLSNHYADMFNTVQKAYNNAVTDLNKVISYKNGKNSISANEARRIFNQAKEQLEVANAQLIQANQIPSVHKDLYQRLSNQIKQAQQKSRELQSAL